MSRPPSQLRRLQLLQASLDTVPQGMAVFDDRARLVAWNAAFAEAMELPALEVGGRVEGIAADDAVGVHKRVRSDGRVVNLVRKPLEGGGFAVHCDLLDEVVRSGGPAALDAIASARLQRITDSIPANIAYVDRDLVYRFANRGYAEWFGQTKESILGRSIRDVVGEALFASVKQDLASAACGRQVTYEYSMQRADGKTVYARSSTLPDLSPTGEAIGFFVLALDITEQRKAQAALTQAQKMEAIGQLTGGLAHDFNNLLTIIMGNLMALQDRLGGGEETEEFLMPALQASQRGAELIKRLLTFARQRPLEPRPVEIGRLALGMSHFLRRSLPETVSIITRLHEKQQFAMADPHQLESALLNLALNARDAMPNGGQLRIETSTADVGEAMARELEVNAGRYVQLLVADTGAGMDAETLSRVFEPFFTTKRFGTGSGLGLSMVYGFVRQSGGSIRFQSEPGRGTTATILLPQCDPPRVEAKVPLIRAPAAVAGEKRLVLLVEDEPQVRRIIRRHLTELGYAVLEAQNGTEAQHLLEHVPEVAVLVTDIVMPGSIDGRELARLARFHRPELRIVLITGHAEGVDGARAGLDLPVLRKPFGRDELARVLEEDLTS